MFNIKDKVYFMDDDKIEVKKNKMKVILLMIKDNIMPLFYSFLFLILMIITVNISDVLKYLLSN